MPRDYKVYLDDILEAIVKIKTYTADISGGRVRQGRQNLGRGGPEPGKSSARRSSNCRWNLNPPIRTWNGKRSVIFATSSFINTFGIDLDIIGDIIRNKVPALEQKVKSLLEE